MDCNNEYYYNHYTDSVIVEPRVYKIPILDQHQIPYTIIDHKANVMGACFYFCLLYALNIDMMTFARRLSFGLVPNDCKMTAELHEPTMLGIHPDVKDSNSCGEIIINSLIGHKYELMHPTRSYPILLRIFPEIRSITTIIIHETPDEQWKHGIYNQRRQCIALRYPTQLDDDTTGLNILILLTSHTDQVGHCLTLIVDQDISSLLFDHENVIRYQCFMKRME